MRVSTSHLQQLAIFTTVLTGGGVGIMYYLMQKKFSTSDYHRLALQKLEACPAAMETIGAPPLKVYNIHLIDRHNRVDQNTAQMKIPVTGSKTGGYLWSLEQAVLKLREGQTINLLTQTAEHTQGLDAGHWH